MAPPAPREYRCGCPASAPAAIDALQRALAHKDINAAVRAAKDLLDRAGLAASKQMQLAVDARPSLKDILVDIERDEQEACDRLHGGQCQDIEG